MATRDPKRGRPRCEASRPARDSVGLCGRPFDLELTEPATRRDLDTRKASPADTAICRAILDALLRPAWPGEAAGWSDALIAEFGSLPAALAVGTSDRARTIGAAPARFLADIQSALLHCLRLPLAERPIISTSQQLLDYLRADMTNLITERFRVLFLTSQNELIADDLVWEGTVGEAPAYPREIVKRALETGATGIILVHNHPSGDHQPSKGDIDATRRIAAASLIMGICLHDHIVVSRSGYSSFRRLGLLETLPRAGAN
ncbi:MAG: repair protein RadC [Sphingomonadales bacterium]|jgi:DNA repair protein RadC|nr:repair protein RadC [Sphingomonadales bacterium]